MNRDFVLFHLGEAEEAIRNTIAEIKANSDYDYGEYRVDIEHVYHHVNTAWNARDASEAAAKECSETDFARWRHFPKDIELIP